MPGILEERLKSKPERNAGMGSKSLRKGIGPDSGMNGNSHPEKAIDPDRGHREARPEGFKNNADANKPQVQEMTDKKAGLSLEGISSEDVEALSGLETLMSEAEDSKEQNKGRLIHRIGFVAMSLLCIYMVMLIYGAATTEYRYNDAGEIEPVVLSVENIQNKNEFSAILAMYLQTRELYETVLTLDYRMASGTEDSMGIAPEYEAALDTVSTLAVQVDASDISSRYNQIKSMLLTWIQTHCAAYCQFMSAAITQNDSNAAAEAIAARQVVNDYFQMITKNIISLGDDIGLFDLSDIRDWSPDTYVRKTYEGLE